MSFGWFWGNLEDLKLFIVEFGVVKFFLYIFGFRIKIFLFGNGDGFLLEEDFFVILFFIVDRLECNIFLRLCNGKGLGKKKRLRKYCKRNKVL